MRLLAAPSPDVKSSVLDRHFTDVIPLLTFIRERFDIEPSASSSQERYTLIAEQWSRLNGTLVGINTPLTIPPPPPPSSSTPFSRKSIHEAVQDAQLQLLTLSSSTRDAHANVILKGYRRPDDRLESFRITSTGRPGLINLYPNSMVTALVLDREWHWVFGKIGAERFVWLLVYTSLFVPLVGGGGDGSCFVQLTGTALSEQRSAILDNHAERRGLKRTHSAATAELGTTSDAAPIFELAKRRRAFERVDSRVSTRSATSGPDLDVTQARPIKAASKSGAVNRRPSEIVIVRSRMFYARCSHDKTGRVQVGLPPVHVLPRSANPKELDKTLPSSSLSSSARDRTFVSAGVELKRDSKAHDQRFCERRARHLAKYVFPRQFGLHNVFTSAREWDTTTQPFRDYTLREVEIKALGAKRTPKALKKVLPVLLKIIKRHDNLKYRALLERCCPSRVPKGRLTEEDRRQIVEDLAEVDTLEPSMRQDGLTNASETNKTPRQALASSTRTSIRPSQLRTSRPANMTETAFELPTPPIRKPRYTNYAVPATGQVVHFITLTLKSLLPRDLFGSLYNQNLILSSVASFVRLRRYESFNLHQIAQSFRFADVDWALPSPSRKITRQEAESRKQLVLELLYWIFDGLVIPLLRTTFYITETTAYRNKVLYFRQDDWHVLSRPVLEQLKETIFEPLTRAEALSMMSSRKLGYSHVRLLPKETGVRPIVNLRRRSTKQVHTEQQASQEAGKRGKGKGGAMASAKQKRESSMLGQSINYILQSVFHVLTYEKTRLLTDGLDDEGGMLSSSVFGPNEIYTLLKGLKQTLLQARSIAKPSRSTSGIRQRKGSVGPGGKKLYFIKLDIRCAFDSIDQAKLLSIISRILHKTSEAETEGYRIHRFAKVMPSSTTTASTGTKKEFVRVARPDTTHLNFFSLASSLSTLLHDVVFVDSVTYRYESTSHILKLLRQHIEENLIKIGKEFYRQRVGIPQGSSLSTLLCSFFFADLEASSPFLQSLTQGRKGMLMRYTDDFLLITPSKKAAKKFFDTMKQGHPEYGCFISPEKTLANFDLVDRTAAASSPIVPRTYGDKFPWCGLTISTRDLGVSADLTRYAGIDIRDTLTVEYSRKPGIALVEKMVQSVKSRCHILFTDTALNGDRRAYANIYSSFLVAALKLTAYLSELRRFRVVFTAEYLFRAIARVVRFTSRYVGSRAASAMVKLHAGKKRSRKGWPRERGRGWKVSCAIQPKYVHWLGYHAFLVLLSGRRGTKMAHANKWSNRSLEKGTKAELVRMLEACVNKDTLAGTRKKMGSIAAGTLEEARKSLPI